MLITPLFSFPLPTILNRSRRPCRNRQMRYAHKQSTSVVHNARNPRNVEHLYINVWGGSKMNS